MSLLGDIGQIVVGAATGGVAGAVLAFTLEHETKLVDVLIDVPRQIVEIGTDVYRAIPDWAFLAAGFPITGLLKHEFENEMIFLGQFGANVAIYASGLTWPADGPITAGIQIAKGIVPVWTSVGSLIGMVHYRNMNDEEWEMAQYIFHDTLPARTDIVLTDIGGVEGRPFTFPGTTGTVFVNLGNRYVPNGHIPEAPVLFHELTHVWQAKLDVLSDIFLYGARVNLPGSNPYVFSPGNQFSDYNTEQQAVAVEAWVSGATTATSTGPHSYVLDSGSRDKFAIASPVFRYINGNIRRGDPHVETEIGRSARGLLEIADVANHHSMRSLNVSLPSAKIWW